MFKVLFFIFLFTVFPTFAKDYYKYTGATSSSGYVSSYDQAYQNQYQYDQGTPQKIYELTSYRPKQENIEQNYQSEQVPQMQVRQQQVQPMQYNQNAQYSQQQNQHPALNYGQSAPYNRSLTGGGQQMQEYNVGRGGYGNNYIGDALDYSRYYVLELSHPFHSNYSYTDNKTGQSFGIGRSSPIPITDRNGAVAAYTGKRLQSLRFLRYETGAKWEILSFEQMINSQKFDILHHNIAASVRGFGDLPISSRAFLSGGLDLGYGLQIHMIGGEQYFTTGFSYGILGGINFKISPSRIFYVMLRDGTIANKSYQVLNTTRDAKFTSFSVSVGIKLISM